MVCAGIHVSVCMDSLEATARQTLMSVRRLRAKMVPHARPPLVAFRAHAPVAMRAQLVPMTSTSALPHLVTMVAPALTACVHSRAFASTATLAASAKVTLRSAIRRLVTMVARAQQRQAHPTHTCASALFLSLARSARLTTISASRLPVRMALHVCDCQERPLVLTARTRAFVLRVTLAWSARPTLMSVRQPRAPMEPLVMILLPRTVVNALVGGLGSTATRLSTSVRRLRALTAARASMSYATFRVCAPADTLAKIAVVTWTSVRRIRAVMAPRATQAWMCLHANVRAAGLERFAAFLWTSAFRLRVSMAVLALMLSVILRVCVPADTLAKIAVVTWTSVRQARVTTAPRATRA